MMKILASILLTFSSLTWANNEVIELMIHEAYESKEELQARPKWSMGASVRTYEEYQESKDPRPKIKVSELQTVDHERVRKLLSQTEQSERWSIPLDIRNEDLIKLAAATSLGLVAFANDEALKKFSQENQTNVTEKLTDVGNILGRQGIAPIIIGSYFLGVVFKNGDLKKAALISIGVALANQVVIESTKSIFGRTRPKKTDDPYEFFGEGVSFFSGHTSAAFALATVFSEIFKKDHPWVPYVAYGLASVAAFARVHDNAHWTSDVIIGAVMGHLVTKIFMRYIERRKENDNKETWWALTPSMDFANQSYMIKVTYAPKAWRPSKR